jgi:hypothetical protein
MPEVVVSGISHRFRWLSPSEGQIAHVLLTRSPLVYPRRGLTARLACVKHAASVRPEPGSNSPLKSSDAHPQKREQDHRQRKQSQQDTKKASYIKESTDRYQNQDKPGPATCRLAIQINSSTFSTLLSSQGSSAHHHQTNRSSAWGNPTKLTGLR